MSWCPGHLRRSIGPTEMTFWINEIADKLYLLNQSCTGCYDPFFIMRRGDCELDRLNVIKQSSSQLSELQLVTNPHW